MSFDRLKSALDLDIPGGIFLLRFDEEGRATPEEAGDIEKLGAPGEGFVWLHLDLGDLRVHALLEKLGVLSEEARETLTKPIDHQFIDHSGNLVRGAIVDYERGLGGRLPQTGYLRFVFGEQFLISARERPLESIEATRLALSAGGLAETPLDLFETIVGHLCDELSKIIFELSASLDRIEEQIVDDGKGFGERATLGVTRRSALRLAREIVGLRSPLLRLEATVSDPEREELREAGARLAHRADILARDLSEVQDRASAAGRAQCDRRPRHQRPPLHSDHRDDAAAAGDLRHRLLRHEHAQSAFRRRRMGHGIRFRRLHNGGVRHAFLHEAHGPDPTPQFVATLSLAIGQASTKARATPQLPRVRNQSRIETLSSPQARARIARENVWRRIL
jgi:zinc transporter